VVKEFRMRIKKRVKRGVKKNLKKVKSAPPEDYLAGAGVLVGSAAALLLATTKRGHELVVRTARLALGQEAQVQEPGASDLAEANEQDSRGSDAQEDVDNEPAENADLEGEPGKETNGAEEHGFTDRKPQHQRPRSIAPGRHPRMPQKAPAAAES
jgi:hypothetical protein